MDMIHIEDINASADSINKITVNKLQLLLKYAITLIIVWDNAEAIALSHKC